MRGLVISAWGEGSRDLHTLLDTLADSRQRAMVLARGREGSGSEKGQILAQFRRVLSTSSARAQAQTLVSRLQVMGDRGRDAARRRNVAGKENRRLEVEMRGQWQAYIRSLGVARGTFFIPS